MLLFPSCEYVLFTAYLLTGCGTVSTTDTTKESETEKRTEQTEDNNDAVLSFFCAEWFLGAVTRGEQKEKCCQEEKTHMTQKLQHQLKSTSSVLATCLKETSATPIRQLISPEISQRKKQRFSANTGSTSPLEWSLLRADERESLLPGYLAGPLKFGLPFTYNYGFQMRDTVHLLRSRGNLPQAITEPRSNGHWLQNQLLEWTEELEPGREKERRHAAHYNFDEPTNKHIYNDLSDYEHQELESRRQGFRYHNKKGESSGGFRSSVSNRAGEDYLLHSLVDAGPLSAYIRH
eukprot:Platyproteum_vivax@DN7139_c0_g1_i2.p1